MSFKTADGLTLRGWYIPCAKETQKTLILLHGYPADKGNILPALAFLHEDFNLLLFDFRYLGKSEGSYSTAGAKEVEDLLAAIQFLKSRGVKEVGVWGFSMGGAVALMAIEKASEIRAVISESSYASLAAMAFELLENPTAKLSDCVSCRCLGQAFSWHRRERRVAGRSNPQHHDSDFINSFVSRCRDPLFPCPTFATGSGKKSQR